MSEPWVVVLLTIAAVVVLRLVVVLILAGGDIERIKLAIRTSFRLLRDEAFGAQVQELAAPPKGPAKPSGEALRILTLLQREGRLIDFLQEDIEGLPDDQIGAAVREVHRKCRHALQEHLVLEAVMPQAEGERVEVQAGFNPSAIQLTGNVAGQPPFRGTLQHPGWRVKEIKITPPAKEIDEFVLQPAEVEIA